MRFTRCDACGAKALMAASQCPKCSHWLGLRDDKGETVPLARCRACQCYYPRRQGGCKWCGTQQSASRMPALAWGGLSVALLAGVAWGATRALGDADAPADPVVTAPIAAVSPRIIVDTSTPLPPPEATPRDTRPPVTVTPSSGPSAPAPAPVQATLVHAAPPQETRARPEQQTAVAAEPRPSRPDAESPADTVRPMPGDEGTARTWVNVRAATGRAAEVLGVITPDTRVRFGELRGAWIRITTADLTGWADRRLFTVVR